MSEYVRGLEEIGREICPSKPLGRKTVLRLIRCHHLPATKKESIGWVVKVEDLKQWFAGYVRGDEGEKMHCATKYP